MNGIKADIFKIKASKTEIKSANKYKNATTFTAIRYIKKMITLPQEFVDFLYIFGAVESKPAFLLQGFLSGNKP
jgi:hypothetical protein